MNLIRFFAISIFTVFVAISSAASAICRAVFLAYKNNLLAFANHIGFIELGSPLVAHGVNEKPTTKCEIDFIP